MHQHVHDILVIQCFPLYFRVFTLFLCTLAVPQMPAHGTVPFQKATHLELTELAAGLEGAGIKPDCCISVRGACCHWATPPHWATLPPQLSRLTSSAEPPNLLSDPLFLLTEPPHLLIKPTCLLFESPHLLIEPPCLLTEQSHLAVVPPRLLSATLSPYCHLTSSLPSRLLMSDLASSLSHLASLLSHLISL
jgi:hypothetical protein